MRNAPVKNKERYVPVKQWKRRVFARSMPIVGESRSSQENLVSMKNHSFRSTIYSIVSFFSRLLQISNFRFRSLCSPIVFYRNENDRSIDWSIVVSIAFEETEERTGQSCATRSNRAQKCSVPLKVCWEELFFFSFLSIYQQATTLVLDTSGNLWSRNVRSETNKKKKKGKIRKYYFGRWLISWQLHFHARSDLQS